MTNPIGRRLDRLETHFEKTTNPGYGPVFDFIDDPKDPDNQARLDEAEIFRRENPGALIICDKIVYPPERRE